MRIKERRVPFDDPAAFELADPLEHGGRRQADRPRYLGLRNSGIYLKKI
jgi:hypothetical protein